MRTVCVMRPSDVMCAFARELEHITSLRAKRATSLCEAQHHGGEAAASLYKVRRSPFRARAKSASKGKAFARNGWAPAPATKKTKHFFGSALFFLVCVRKDTTSFCNFCCKHHFSLSENIIPFVDTKRCCLRQTVLCFAQMVWANAQRGYTLCKHLV